MVIPARPNSQPYEIDLPCDMLRVTGMSVAAGTPGVTPAVRVSTVELNAHKAYAASPTVLHMDGLHYLVNAPRLLDAQGVVDL